jgi:hypothetical protein
LKISTTSNVSDSADDEFNEFDDEENIQHLANQAKRLKKQGITIKKLKKIYGNIIIPSIYILFQKLICMIKR